MRLLVVVNDPADVQPGQTTAMLVHRAAWREHEVSVCGVGDLGLDPDGRLLVRARRVVAGEDRAAVLGQLSEAAPVTVGEDALDAILLRTNPARDAEREWLHEGALTLTAIARDHGVVVVNDPVGLVRGVSKIYLSTLPAHCRPVTLVSRDPGALVRFVEEAQGPAVLKPVKGTRGTDVFLVRPDARYNLRQIVDVVTRRGLAMAQHFVPEASTGDVRLVLLEGRLLEVDGQVAAVRRVPPESGDFRSNVFVGGTAQPVEVTPAMRRVAEAVGPRLVQDGLFLVGLDLIGEVVVEANVFSPGGLEDAERFSGRDFIAPILDALERRLARS